ncbi:MAG: MarR family transcriptional regulator [Mycobacteriales bacterium]
MNAGELHRLARTLREIALVATANPGEPPVSAGLLAVVEDVAHNPGASVGKIAARTGLAQSQVSTTVARMRQAGVFTTETDPADGRRNLVSVNPATRANQFGKRAARPIETALLTMLRDSRPARLTRITGALDVLLAELLG